MAPLSGAHLQFDSVSPWLQVLISEVFSEAC
jgi:hypothetical protein